MLILRIINHSKTLVLVLNHSSKEMGVLRKLVIINAVYILIWGKKKIWLVLIFVVKKLFGLIPQVVLQYQRLNTKHLWYFSRIFYDLFTYSIDWHIFMVLRHPPFHFLVIKLKPYAHHTLMFIRAYLHLPEIIWKCDSLQFALNEISVKNRPIRIDNDA